MYASASRIKLDGRKDKGTLLEQGKERRKAQWPAKPSASHMKRPNVKAPHSPKTEFVRARTSSARVHQYATNLPPRAPIRITSLKWFRPRTISLEARELFLHGGRISGAMTLRREVPKEVWERRNWYDWAPIKKFTVWGKSSKQIREAGVWEELLTNVVKGWDRTEKLAKK
ncbi:MAG: hypothetical protein Q9159_001604 [Coniocarpon cinnabarinum]